MPRPPTSSLERWLDSPLVSHTLLIVVFLSVIPEFQLDARFGLPLFGLFGTIALARASFEKRRHTSHHLLLVADILVAMTFLPLHRVFPWVDEGVLQLLRLTRLLALARPSRHLMRDLLAILTREERLQQFMLVTTAVALTSVFGGAFLITANPDFDFNSDRVPGNGDFIDAIWWTFRQLESADNLVATVCEPPTVVVMSLLLTVAGVFVIAFIIGIGADVVEQVVRAQRRRPLETQNHSLVIGPVHGSEILITELAGILEKNRALRSLSPRLVWRWLTGNGPRPRRHAMPVIALLGDEDQPPDYLFQPELRFVQYRRADCTTPQGLDLVGASQARRVLLLSRHDLGDEADALTLATLAAVRRLTSQTYTYVELLDAANRPLVQKIGGPRTWAIDLPRLMGQFLCQHLVVPGVDHIYRELLTSAGSEFYTHIFVETWELEALQHLVGEGHLDWMAMVSQAHRCGVSLLGVFLGPSPESGAEHRPGVHTDDLELWLNPEQDPPEALARWRVKRGEVPISALRGLVGLSPTYTEMRELGRMMLAEPPHTCAEQSCTQSARVASELVHDDGHLGRVMVVGDSRALQALLAELMMFRPRAELFLLLPREPDTISLEKRLAGLPLRWESAVGNPEAPGGLSVATRHPGVTFHIFVNPGTSMGQFSVEVADRLGLLDACIFLSEGRGNDPDARTSLRALRFVSAFANHQFQCGETLHVLVELRSHLKGELLEESMIKIGDPRTRKHLRLTQISTERISNFFLVHSAFVPAVQPVWDELLGEHGQNLMRMTWHGGAGSVSFGGLSMALSARCLMPIAYQVEGPGGEVDTHINPSPEEVLDLSHLRTVYVLGQVSSVAQPPPQPQPQQEQQPPHTPDTSRQEGEGKSPPKPPQDQQHHDKPADDA